MSRTPVLALAALIGSFTACSSRPCQTFMPSVPSPNGCDGNKVEATVWEDGDCPQLHSVIVEDCEARGQECFDGECVLAGERCPPGVEGFCRDGLAHVCLHDRVRSPKACDEPRACWDVMSPDNMPTAVCALEPTPCHHPRDETGLECHGDVLVECLYGWPQRQDACDELGEVCREDPSNPFMEHYARCSIDLPCPKPGNSVCHDDGVYACPNGYATSEVRDCTRSGDVCISLGDRGFCSASSDGPAPAQFVLVSGGTFAMGPRGASLSVSVDDFELLDREVTAAEYQACVSAGACSQPAGGGARPGCEAPLQRNHADLPVTCVSFEQAENYCAFIHARLPTPAEWEFALRNRGQDVENPWGDAAASCEHAIVSDALGPGCGRNEPWSGCSKPDDRTEQGICDLAGNVQEWTAMTLDRGVTGAPRGGSYDHAAARSPSLRTPYQGGTLDPEPNLGVRCAR